MELKLSHISLGIAFILVMFTYNDAKPLECTSDDDERIGNPVAPPAPNWLDDHQPLIDLKEPVSVRNLRNYIRIQTVHPAPEMGYSQAIIWLQLLAQDIGLGFRVVDFDPPNLFAVIITWEGKNTSLKSVLFNSHMDVVPTEPEFWSYHPFDAYKDEKGNIYGRGASDMKSATVATLEAIRTLKKSGFQPERTIHVTVLPDEEVGGLRGMQPFVDSVYFKELNVGIDIDEGGVNPDPDTLKIYYGEKSPWEFRVTAVGEESHSSTLPEYTSGQRLEAVVNKLMNFRSEQLKKLNDSNLTLDQITSLNLVGLGGGISPNVIPARLWASFDMRIRRTDYNFTDIQSLLDATVAEATALGPVDRPVSIDFSLKSEEIAQTVADSSNIWFTVVQSACKEMNISCPAAFASPVSDARWVRTAGIPAFGIGPFLNTPFKAHTVNEFINESEYLKGIERYQVLIRHLSTLPHSNVDDQPLPQFTFYS